VRAIDVAANTDLTPAHQEWSVKTNTQTPPNPPQPGQAEFLRTVRNKKSGVASLVFRVTGPGQITTRAALVSEVAKPNRKGDAKAAAQLKAVRLQQRSIKPVSTSVVGAGEVKVPIKLTPIGERLLREDHRLEVRINVSFVALDGSTTNWKLDVKLIKRPSSRQKKRNQAF